MPKFPPSLLGAKSAFFYSIPKSPRRVSALAPGMRFFSTPTTRQQVHELPLLKKLVDTTLNVHAAPPLKNTAIICVTHAFHTVLPLLSSFVQLGAAHEKIFVMGKLYSECEDVVQEIKKAGFYYQHSTRPAMLGGFHRSFMRDINRLLTKCMTTLAPTDNLLILDHGGHALAFAPPELLEGRNVVGIEKTTAGLLHPEVAGVPFPIIRMADCAAKKILEPPLIAKEVVQKLMPLIPLQTNKLICGVVGYGAIGKAIADKLRALGHEVMVYDRHKEKIQHLPRNVRMPELAVLVTNSDYILDCTGEDISTTTEIVDFAKGNKTLISCSSEDKAFRSLLQFVQSKYKGKVPVNALNEISYTNEIGFTIRILRGGFPINFDNISEASLPEDIQLTRALVLSSVIQAAGFFNKPHLLQKAGSYMLDPSLQKFVSCEWLKDRPLEGYPPKITADFEDETWIASKSGGQQESSEVSSQHDATTNQMKLK